MANRSKAFHEHLQKEAPSVPLAMLRLWINFRAANRLDRHRTTLAQMLSHFFAEIFIVE
jgi:hypothetical protein